MLYCIYVGKAVYLIYKYTNVHDYYQFSLRAFSEIPWMPAYATCISALQNMIN